MSNSLPPQIVGGAGLGDGGQTAAAVSPGRPDLFGLYAGYYVAELLGELTDENDPHPELFDLADETLEALAAGEAVARRIVRFELGALRLLGHMPALDAAPNAARRWPATGPGRLRAGPRRRAMPQVPRRESNQVIAVSAGVLRTMAQLADPHGPTWRRMEIDPRTWENSAAC